MTEELEELDRTVRRAAGQYHQLVLLVGPPGSGKTRLLEAYAEGRGHSLLNVSLLLSQRMLELSRKQRSRQAEGILKSEMARHEGKVVLLDNTEILFDRGLEVKPVTLLQSCSRNRTVVAAWAGSFSAGTLSYASPGHPEYEQVRSPEAIILSLPLSRREARP